MSRRPLPKTRALPARPSFSKLVLSSGDYNAELRERMNGRSGVYILRKIGRKRPMYVGESHTGRAWKTMLRHVQAQKSFRALGEWTYCCPKKLEVAFIETRASEAVRTEARAIDRYQPTANVKKILSSDGVPF